MQTMEIYFSSLTAEAQQEYISMFGHDDNVEADMFPIAMIDREGDDDSDQTQD